jgi:hypothetical protein
MGDKPIVAFDTSAINGLADDLDCAALLPEIRANFHARLSATSVGELIATPDVPRRSKLLALCNGLMHSGDCIHNAYQLLQMLIRDFERVQEFDWRSVDVRFQEAEDVLRSGAAFDDGESQSVCEENREAKRKFEEFYRRLNPLCKQAFAQGGATRPASLKESVERLKKTRSFEKMASVLYAYISARDPKRDPPPASAVERFLCACPPFHAYLLGFCAARYTRNLKPSQSTSMKAGALDSSMAVCLPYCDVFVTNDGGMQNCFKEIGAVAGLPLEVLSLDCCRQRLAPGQARETANLEAPTS